METVLGTFKTCDKINNGFSNMSSYKEYGRGNNHEQKQAILHVDFATNADALINIRLIIRIHVV